MIYLSAPKLVDTPTVDNGKNDEDGIDEVDKIIVENGKSPTEEIKLNKLVRKY